MEQQMFVYQAFEYSSSCKLFFSLWSPRPGPFLLSSEQQVNLDSLTPCEPHSLREPPHSWNWILFSPINLPHSNLTLIPARRTQRAEEKLYLLCPHNNMVYAFGTLRYITIVTSIGPTTTWKRLEVNEASTAITILPNLRFWELAWFSQLPTIYEWWSKNLNPIWFEHLFSFHSHCGDQ